MCQRFETDRKDVTAMVGDLESWSSYSKESKEIQELKSRFQNFEIIYIPRGYNGTGDHLTRKARSFDRDICFVGYCIPVWLSKPLQA